VEVKKSGHVKSLIRQYSRDFDGTLYDKDVMAILEKKIIPIPIKSKNGQMTVKEQSAKVAETHTINIKLNSNRKYETKTFDYDMLV